MQVKALKQKPQHTPDPLIKAAEAMDANKRRGKRNVHQRGGSEHYYSHKDIVNMIPAGKSGQQRQQHTPDTPASPALLAKISTAIKKIQIVEITYRDYEGNKTKRRIWPQEWVKDDLFTAYCELRGEERHFRVCRIQECRVVGIQKMNKLFPKEDVERCRRRTRLQKSKRAMECLDGFKVGAKVECPSCGKTSNELLWLYFESPKWTWEELCGHEGWLVLCDDCDQQLEFFCTLLN